ncbi:MAG: signal transduction histidine kinase [Bacteriovoracaceae bacterium]|jgi:signal transduction histidine kinase
MKTLLNGIKYNIKNYLVAWCLFSSIWLICSSVLLFHSTTENFVEGNDSIKVDLEAALESNDLIKIKEVLWKAKGPNIKRLSFYPNKEFSLVHSNLEIGQYSQWEQFEIERRQILVLNGFKLGHTIIYINTIDLLRSSFVNNLGLFIFVALFFIFLTLFANIRTAKALYNIESKIDLLNDEDFDNLEIALSQVPEKSWSALSGFKGFIYNHLRLSKEKLALDQELNEFEFRYKLAREVAHGIKSPIHTLNVLNKKLSPKMTESEQKLFKMACERVNFHANEILTQNSENQRFSQVNVKNAIQKLINMKQNEFQKYKNIKITYIDHSGMNLKLPIQGIYEVLSNLINNAFDAIEVDEGEIKISTKVSQGMLVIECIDSGKGIPQSVIENIWDNNFSYEKKHGTGIGLSVIKELVEVKWKGNCLASSIEGLGARFELNIPLLELKSKLFVTS